jgi:RNA polymerase sigma-70 factor, ECF subfamily
MIKIVEEDSPRKIVQEFIVNEGHRAEAMGYARRILGNFHDAEDLLQEACLKAWRAAGRYNPSQKINAWFYTIMKRTALDMLAIRRGIQLEDSEERDEFTPEYEERPDEKMIREETHAALNQAIKAIPRELRESLIVYYSGETEEETGKILGIAGTTVHERLNKAIGVLKDNTGLAKKVA